MTISIVLSAAAAYAARSAAEAIRPFTRTEEAGSDVLTPTPIQYREPFAGAAYLAFPVYTGCGTRTGYHESMARLASGLSEGSAPDLSLRYANVNPAGIALSASDIPRGVPELRSLRGQYITDPVITDRNGRILGTADQYEAFLERQQDRASGRRPG